MTREEVEQMPAGDEMDALVGRLICGDVWAGIMSSWPFPFSKNIEAAWLVVQNMAAKGMWMKLHSPFMIGDLWWASFDEHGCTDSRPFYSAGAEEAPLAICRAALLTTLSNEPNQDPA